MRYNSEVLPAPDGWCACGGDTSSSTVGEESGNKASSSRMLNIFFFVPRSVLSLK